MKKTITIFVLIVVSLIKVNAQTYDASPYCKFKTFEAGSWDDFTSIQIGALHQTMAARSASNQYDSDYVYFKSVTATAFNRGGSYPLQINYEKMDGEIMVMTVFIDYNQNNVFEANEVAYNKMNLDYQDTIVNGTITIPITALTGTTRMRVMMMDTNSVDPAATADPCAQSAGIQNPLGDDHPYYGQTVDFDVTINDTTTGVNILTPDMAGMLYPNPASDVFYLPKELSGANIIISDITGRTIARHNKVNSSVDVHALSAGTYMVRIAKDGQVYNQRLSVVK